MRHAALNPQTYPAVLIAPSVSSPVVQARAVIFSDKSKNPGAKKA